MERSAGSRERVLQSVTRDDIELIRFLWVDHNSITRGKAVSAAALPFRMSAGVGLAKSRQSSSLFDVGVGEHGFGAVGEVRLVPDPDSYVRLPHAPGSAAMLCDLETPDAEPWDGCPRTFLKDAVRAAGDLQVVAAFEPEFTLLRGEPAGDTLELADDSLCFDNEGFDAVNDLAVALSRALREAGLEVETYHPEFAAGQHEMTLRHGPALRAADHFVWQRLITRGLARDHGLRATFAPVPAPGLRGNGNHLHLSLWQADVAGGTPVNVFADGNDPLGLTPLARHFIGGLLAHLPALTALTCASVNSYHRLQPGMWAGAHGAYGLDNRETAIRIPTPLRGDGAGTTNIEFKASDATANPYLALGALIHAGLDGIRRQLDPGEPLTEDPSRMTDAELRRRGVIPLPRSLEEAVDALEADDYLMAVLGPLRAAVYPAIKRADVRDLKELGAGQDHLTYAKRF